LLGEFSARVPIALAGSVSIVDGRLKYRKV
jgi:hypothetical protein